MAPVSYPEKVDRPVCGARPAFGRDMTRASATAQRSAGRTGVETDPIREATPVIRAMKNRLRTASAAVRPGQHRGAGPRQVPEPVDHPGGQVVAADGDPSYQSLARNTSVSVR